MIWSFVKVALFLALVAVLALVGAHLADSARGLRRLHPARQLWRQPRHRIKRGPGPDHGRNHAAQNQ